MQAFIVSLLALCVLYVLYVWYTTPKKASLLDIHTAKDMLRKKQIKSVVDVRNAEEYQKGHYPDAISFPHEIINPQTVAHKEVGEFIYSPTLVYCNSGRRAKHAANLLAKYGIDTVYYVKFPYESLI